MKKLNHSLRLNGVIEERKEMVVYIKDVFYSIQIELYNSYELTEYEYYYVKDNLLHGWVDYGNHRGGVREQIIENATSEQIMLVKTLNTLKDFLKITQ